MIGLFTQNLGWKLFALLVAVLFWIAVSSEPELSTFTSLPVEFKNLPDELEISSEVVETVHLELRGPSGELRTFSESRTAVVLDMSGVRRGQQTFPIASENVKLPRNIYLVRAMPSQLRFDFERRLTQSVPVEVRFADNAPAGYQVVKWEVTPRTLTILGPESRVSRVRGVRTDPINLTSVVGTAEFHVNAYIEDPRVRFQSSPQVAVKVSMRKK